MLRSLRTSQDKSRAALKQEKPKASRVVGSTSARAFGIWIIALICLAFALWGCNPPAMKTPTVTPSVTVKPPTSTATVIPFTHTPAFTPTSGIGSTMISEKDGMVLVYVPEGEFTMGSNNGNSDEKPEHQVILDAFWIDQTEVTNGMFSKFVEETNYQTDVEKAGWSYVFNGSEWEKIYGASWRRPKAPANSIPVDNKPVLYISWNDAYAYCSWAGRRLPTEAEWEKAARGTDGSIYPWGNTFDGTRLNFCDKNCIVSWADKSFDDGYADVAPVGSFPSGQSVYKVFDMAGNAWEWVNDWYSDTYYQNSPSSNPLGPQTGQNRILRGGSWDYHSDGARSASRLMTTAVTDNYVGLRCARSP